MPPERREVGRRTLAVDLMSASIAAFCVGVVYATAPWYVVGGAILLWVSIVAAALARMR